MQNELLIKLLASLQSLVLLLSAQVANPEPKTVNNMASSVSIHQPVSTNSQSNISTQATPSLSFTAINNLYKNAVINILCRGSGKFKGGTASGVFVSPSGLILTNAHIAQYMLLEQTTNAPIRCTIRTGSPAEDAYKAQVVYMPPNWVKKHAKQITKTAQLGTGQDDYALLQIIETTDRQKILPKTFSYIPIDAHQLTLEESTQKVLVRAYPAELVGSNIALKALRAISTVTNLQEPETFATYTQNKPGTIDLISLGGTIVAQGGSSGGAVINKNAKLIGIIVTSTRKKETKDRDLKAITLSHINQSIKSQTGKSIAEMLEMPTEELLMTYQKELLNSAKLFASEYNK